MPPFDDVQVGDTIPGRSRRLEQVDVIRYAGASGDFNRLHWDERFAAEVSPTGGVIAHGMLSMGLLSAVVTAWAGGPGDVERLSAHFRAPVPVGSEVTVGGEVIALDEEARTATLAVWVELPDGSRVVDRRRSRAVVRLT